MKHLLFALLSLVLGFTAHSQTTAWLRHFSTSDTLHSALARSQDYLLLAHGSGGLYQLRVSFDGQLLDSLPLGATPDDAVFASDSGFFKVFLQDTINLRLQKLAPDGTLVWEQLISDTTGQITPRLSALADGGCFLVSATVPSITNIYPRTVVRRISNGGDLLWKKYLGSVFSPYNPQCRVADCLTLPDAGVMVLYNDLYSPWVSYARANSLKQDGDPAPQWAFSADLPTFGDYKSANISLARVTSSTDFLAAGLKIAASSGGNPIAHQWGYLAQSKLLNAPREVLFPPTHSSQGFTTYQPYPVSMAPLLNGDVLLVLQQNQEARLWRGSWDLKDTCWERPLTPAGGWLAARIDRPNRLLYATPDQGAVVAGVDSAGIFLMKIDPWGNTAPTPLFSTTGQVLEDTDFYCVSPGPYQSSPGVRVRLTQAGSNPPLRWWATTDAQGGVSVVLPEGTWKAEMADSMGAIYGRSCQPEVFFQVGSGSPEPDFVFPVLRYKARLKGQIWRDDNGNCLMDEGNSYFGGGKKVLLQHNDQSFVLNTDYFSGAFSADVDTGWYRLQVQGLAANVFNGYYCRGDSIYLPTYQTTDSIVLMWSKLVNCKLIPSITGNTDYNCTGSNAPWNTDVWVNVRDVKTGAQQVLQVTNGSIFSQLRIYGAGQVAVDFVENMGDSLICSPDLPHLLNYPPLTCCQILTDTLRAHFPRLHDSLYVCPGAYVYGGSIVTQDTVLWRIDHYPTTGPYAALVPYYHHVFVWPTPVTHLTVVDTTLAADTTQVFVLQTVHGCDSTVYVHYLTTGTHDLSATLPPLWLEPNPATDFVNVVLPSADFVRLELCDFSGKVLTQTSVLLGEQTVRLAVNSAPAGVYVVRAFRRDGRVLRGRLLVNR